MYFEYQWLQPIGQHWLSICFLCLKAFGGIWQNSTDDLRVRLSRIRRRSVTCKRNSATSGRIRRIWQTRGIPPRLGGHHHPAATALRLVQAVEGADDEPGAGEVAGLAALEDDAPPEFLGQRALHRLGAPCVVGGRSPP